MLYVASSRFIVITRKFRRKQIMRYDNGLCISLYLTRIQRWGNIKKCICVYYGLNFFNFFVGHALWTSYPENSEPSMYVPFLFKHPPNLFGDIYAIFNWILMQRYIERYILMYILMIFFTEYSMICYALQIRNQ